MLLSKALKNWLAWWETKSFFARTLPVLLWAIYLVVLIRVGGIHGDLVFASTLSILLYYGGPLTYPIFEFGLPFLLVTLLYDSQRYFADLIRGPIHVQEPYQFDKFFFGIRTAAGVLTPNEWWQLHTHPVLDFLTGTAYIIFIPVFILCAAYFRFWTSRKGTKTCPAWSIRYRSPQITWAFLVVNIIGWSTYYWYAASPPWYVALYGLGPARLEVPANLAGCVRFDTLIGYPVFHEFYGRAADVHGAIPSLHVSYPFMAFYYALRFGTLRIFTLVFYLLMCFSAVYLNHHYLLDVMVGTLYGGVVAFTMDMVWNSKLKRQMIPESLAIE